MSRTAWWALLLVLGCSSTEPGRTHPASDDPRDPLPVSSLRTPPRQSPRRDVAVALPDPVTVSADARRALAQASNAFAIDLYKQLPRQGNVVFSPASIAFALTMTWAGARGDTAREMAHVLHVADVADVHRITAATLRRFNDPSEARYELRVANRLFGEQSYRFEPAYLELTRASYGAPLEALPFHQDREGARRHINDWVAGQTRDRILDLLPEDAIDADTRLVLTNAIYLLAKWVQPFEHDATFPRTFWRSGQRQTQKPTMHQTTTALFGQTSDATLLELRYQGGPLAMLFVLPSERAGLPALEDALSAERIAQWTSLLAAKEVAIALPKFRIEPGQALRLRPALEALGLRRAFQRGAADFTGIANPDNRDQRLFVRDAFHKALVAVDEEGTEAAAATAVVMAPEGAARPSEPPHSFIADHPFLFLLRDVDTGMVLFLGRVDDPS